MAEMSGKITPVHKLVSGIQRPIVHCHGCFDLLHIGHVRHLEAAKKMGMTLIVTVTADKHVDKGNGRPVFSADQRAEMLAALECVDYVAVNDHADACNAVQAIRPDFYVKGSDYANTDCVEFEAVRKSGAEIKFTHTEKFSTTELIERIKQC